MSNFERADIETMLREWSTLTVSMAGAQTQERIDAVGSRGDMLHTEFLRRDRQLATTRARLAEATALINAAVELMTPDQVGRWVGVRAWLESGDANG